MSHPPYTVDGEAICSLLHYCWDFPGSSVGKESACNAGDPVLIAGSESSPGEGVRLTTPVFLGANESRRLPPTVRVGKNLVI